MPFDEFKAALEKHGVKWRPAQSSIGGGVFMGFFQRMLQGQLRSAYIHLMPEDRGIVHPHHVENVYRRLAIVPDTSTFH